MTRSSLPSPQELVARGLTRDQARFAAWVLAQVALAPDEALSAARLAEQWSTDRSWVCRALSAIAEAGVWRLERVGRLVRIAPVSVGSLSGEQRSAPFARCSEDNERRAVRCLGDNQKAPRCLRSNNSLPLRQREIQSNSSNQKHLQLQTTNSSTPRAAPSAAAAKSSMVSEERGGLGRHAATGTAEQVNSLPQGDTLRAVESLLGRTGLSGRLARDLAHRVVQQASVASRDPIALATAALAAAQSAKNPAGWLRRAIELGWILERAKAIEPAPAIAIGPNARAPLDAPPRVSRSVWDLELERAALYAICGSPDHVAWGRGQLVLRGGVARSLARFREQIDRAPEALLGVLHPSGLAHWRELAPQLEQLAAAARERAIESGAIVNSAMAGGCA